MEARASLIPARCGGLVSKIHSGECVLVLGPRVVLPTAISADVQTPLDDYISRELLSDLGEQSDEQPNLRQILTRYETRKGASALRGVYQGLVAGLDQQTTALHRDLASLPFRLVLMATPDRMMINAFNELAEKKGAIEDYYDYSNVASPDRPSSLPSLERPIVYSLFGRHDHPESLVLTDKNLLEYLIHLTREDPALPDPVRATLRAPSTSFLFVGFGFSNWWLRLMLKVLEVTGVENRLLSLALEDNHTFAAPATLENKGFFESAGIYIQAGDWTALARELAESYRSRPKPAATSSPMVTAAPIASAISQVASAPRRGPLVFLSYASEDRELVNAIRQGLEQRGVAVWQDWQNLRVGQNWENKIEEFIKRVDYFVFIQTEAMDQRRDGVYNSELKMALERVKVLMADDVFVMHVVVGNPRPRPEKELAAIHQFRLGADHNVDALGAQILESYAARPDLAANTTATRAP